MTVKYKTTTIGVSWVTARKGWGTAALVLEDQMQTTAKKVVIEIEQPSDLSYIRERLNDIENEWKRQLSSLNQTE